MSNQLLPCPFCGGKAEIESDDSDYPCHDAVCQECGARCHVTGCGPDDGWEWNRRATQPAAGEPVAYGPSLGQLEREFERFCGSATIQRDASEYYSAPLYAAPPAAAHGDEAVLPERREVPYGTWGDMGDAYSAGWNDCLDQLAAMRAQGDEEVQ